MRKNHSSSFKAQLVLEMLKEEKTVSEPRLNLWGASHHAAYPSQGTGHWKKQVVAGLPQVFERERDAKAAQEASERKIEELYTEIGRSQLVAKEAKV